MREELPRHVSLLGAVTAALGASACCVGPLVFAGLGVGGAGAFVALAAYRPMFIGLSVGMLAMGWVLALRVAERRVAPWTDDCGCEAPDGNRAGRGTLWLATATVVGLVAFPYLTPLFL